jgi:serine-type D-Ala-D-Ala carboxypeptidase (penicillin-binding protein 5/6)
MASLTKIVTAIVTIKLAQEFKLNLNNTFFKVSKNAAETPGTTANLIEAQRISIMDLLYGLMLPSGNDAAVTLAENFSERLRQAPGKRDKPM